MMIQVPAGSVITVAGGPRADDRRMVDVYWNGHKILMFVVDIQDRGELVADAY